MLSQSFLSKATATLLCVGFALSTSAHAADTQPLEELRNTVINLLEGLVQKGVITREQAQAMVQDAQEKSAAQAKAKSEQEAAEKDAVRVTHVPEIVRKQISDQVREELRPEVTKEVIAQAKKDKWGVPGALPEWVGRMSWFGDIRVRGQYDDYAENKSLYCGDTCYLDFFAINRSGGFTQASQAGTAFLNTTNDRLRERLRLRFGMSAKLAQGVSATMRLSTGSLTDPVSTNQTLGQSGARYQLAVDQAYLRFDAGVGYNPKFPWLTVWAGRMPNPFLSSDLIWDGDLQFDGLASTVRIGVGGRPSDPRNVFLTLGAFPLQEIEISTDDKWLYAGQLGFDWPLGTRGNDGGVRLAVAYYYFDNVTGVPNPSFGSRLTDLTAPQWMQKGNTLFDIRNDLGSTRLFALASEYHVANAMIGVEWPVGQHKVLFNADYVTNLGYDEAEVSARGALKPPGLTTDGRRRVNGYQTELGFGTAGARIRGDWRAYVGYRYVERDAVLDAFTDSDFHLGGTDAKGYQLRGEWWFRDRVSVALRYLSANEIDGNLVEYNDPVTNEPKTATTPFGVDTLMLDINGQF